MKARADQGKYKLKAQSPKLLKLKAQSSKLKATAKKQKQLKAQSSRLKGKAKKQRLNSITAISTKQAKQTKLIKQIQPIKPAKTNQTNVTATPTNKTKKRISLYFRSAFSFQLSAFATNLHFLAATVLLSLTLIASWSIDFREKVPAAKSFKEFPLTIGDWTGRSQVMEQRFIDSLDLSDYAIVDYHDPGGRTVNFYAAYYESQRKGESIHSPATCLPGSGWEFKQAGSVPLPVKNSSTAMKVNRAVMQKGDYKQLAYYWFPQHGRVLTNVYQLKLFTFWNALTEQRTDGALVRLITPIYPDETGAEADERLAAFAASLVPVLNSFLPE